MRGPSKSTGPRSEGRYNALTLIVGLLVLWLVVVIIGFTASGLSWLAIIGLVLFVGTGVFEASSIDAARD